MPRDEVAALAAGEPRPAAVAVLRLLQFLERGSLFLSHPLEIEHRSQSLLVGPLTLRVEHPGGLLQHHLLQFLVLF